MLLWAWLSLADQPEASPHLTVPDCPPSGRAFGDMETLITADDLQARVRALAGEIRRDHPDGVHLIGVLKGSFIFLADLARCLAEDTDGKGVTMDFMAASS